MFSVFVLFISLARGGLGWIFFFLTFRLDLEPLGVSFPPEGFSFSYYFGPCAEPLGVAVTGTALCAHWSCFPRECFCQTSAESCLLLPRPEPPSRPVPPCPGPPSRPVPSAAQLLPRLPRCSSVSRRRGQSCGITQMLPEAGSCAGTGPGHLSAAPSPRGGRSRAGRPRVPALLAL